MGFNLEGQATAFNEFDRTDPELDSLSLGATGFPSPADNYREQALRLDDYLIRHPAATFLIRAEDDAMIRVGIFTQDLLIVDRALPALPGKVVIAVLNWEFLLRRLATRDGKLFLAPANPQYPVIALRESMDFQIWGVVQYVIHQV